MACSARTASRGPKVPRRSLIVALAASASSVLTRRAVGQSGASSAGTVGLDLKLEVPFVEFEVSVEGAREHQFAIPTSNGGPAGIAIHTMTLDHLKGDAKLRSPAHYMPNNLRVGESYEIPCTWPVLPTSQDTARGRVTIRYGYSADDLSERRKGVEREFGKPFLRFQSIYDQLVKLGPDTSVVDRRASKEIERWGRRAPELEKIIADRILELEEIERGEFCSTCGRSRSRVEAELHIPFDQHIADGATAGRKRVPATEAQLAEARKRIDDARSNRDREVAANAETMEKLGRERAVAVARYDAELKKAMSDVNAARQRLGDAKRVVDEMGGFEKTVSFPVLARWRKST